VHLLRRALGEAGFDGIETVHGTGWRIVAPTAA
ncbi:MAG: DNA-binding response regulator, partial [Achromobacter sp.]